MARMTIWPGFIEDSITTVQWASQWWDEINESTKWQDGIFYTLSAAYALVAAVALVSLCFTSPIPLKIVPVLLLLRTQHNTNNLLQKQTGVDECFRSYGFL
jgi:hypothetical protein